MVECFYMINKIKGIILYEGPSLIDNEPIVCVATGVLQGTKSKNPKTGDMIQTWLFRSDIHPFQAIQESKDVSVCGSCKHRRSLNGSCYVLPMSVGNVYKAYKAGKYIPLDDDNIVLFKDRLIRWGSYGNISAMPYEIVDKILKKVKGHTSYIHNWNDPNIDIRFRNMSMASVDSPKEMEEAQKLGYRTFRIKNPDDPVLKGEFVCPASEEMGKKRTCQKCLACNGGSFSRKGSVVINVHGILKNRFKKLTINGK